MLQKFYQPERLLFKLSQSDKTFMVNPESNCLQDKKRLFNLFGKIIGKALFQRIPVNLSLHISLYKILLGESLTLQDLHSVDQVVGLFTKSQKQTCEYLCFQLYQSYKYILQNDIQSDQYFEQYFVTEYKFQGNTIQHQLITNGATTKVDNKNKDFYINLMVQWNLQESIEEQLKQIKQGFFSIIPEKSVRNVFTNDELQLMMCGNPFIDVQDWYQNTQYQKGYTKNSIVRQFWCQFQIIYIYIGDKKLLERSNWIQLGEVVQIFTLLYRYYKSTIGRFQVRMLFLRVKFEPNRMLESNRGEYKKFTIRPSVQSIGPSANHVPLPVAHTCFNRIQLPKYKNIQQMRQGMVYVTDNQAMGYGMV